MRITNKMLSNNFLTDMQSNLQNMQTLQQQMSTGKLISKPSDDPLGTTKVMQLNSQIDQNGQYSKNISNATNWLNTTDTSLGQVNNVLQRINELLVSVGDPSYGTDEQQSIKDEINTNVGQLSQIINTSYDGNYIFGGSRGTDKPTGTQTDASGNTQIDYVNTDGTTPITNQQIGMIKSNLSTEISQGVSVQYNVTAGQIMEFNNDSGTTKDLRTILSNITSDLDSSNVTNLTGSDLSDITDAANNISKLRTQVGAIENRMSSAQSQNEAENTNLTTVLSKTDDVDVAQATMQYSSAQTVYLASLQVSAKILQPSLMDYLK
jgi:flagellar hook-associated protein 3 FlgL